jgi:MFS family permease
MKLPAFDYAGSALSFAALLSLIILLSRLNSAGPRSPVIMTALSIFLLSGAAFVLWERHTPHPLLDYSLFRSRSFNLGNLANFLCLSFLAGHNFIIPFYLMVIKGLPPQKAGSVFLLYSLVYMGIGPVAGRLTRRVSPRTLCTAALGFGVVVALGFSLLLRGDGMLAVYAYFVGMALVMATFIPANNTLVMGLAPPGKQGVVAGSFRMIGRVGMTFGICLFQAIFTWSASQGGPLHLEAMKGIERMHLLNSFSAVYLAGGMIFVIGAIGSLLARERERA